jgi:hypothetical protein
MISGVLSTSSVLPCPEMPSPPSFVNKTVYNFSTLIRPAGLTTTRNEPAPFFIT